MLTFLLKFSFEKSWNPLIMHKNYQIFFQKVLVVWLIPSMRLYFLHADSAILSHSLSKLSERMSCGGCWLSPTLVCLSQQFACIHWKAENSCTQKTGDTELSWKPNFKIFSCCERALFHYVVCLCIYFWRMMGSPLFYENWTIVRSPGVWDGLLFGFLKENKIN